MEKNVHDYVKYELKDQLSMLGRQYSLLSFMDAVYSWCEASGFPYSYDRTKKCQPFLPYLVYSLQLFAHLFW